VDLGSCVTAAIVTRQSQSMDTAVMSCRSGSIVALFTAQPGERSVVMSSTRGPLATLKPHSLST